MLLIMFNMYKLYYRIQVPSDVIFCIYQSFPYTTLGHYSENPYLITLVFRIVPRGLYTEKLLSTTVTAQSLEYRCTFEMDFISCKFKYFFKYRFIYISCIYSIYISCYFCILVLWIVIIQNFSPCSTKHRDYCFMKISLQSTGLIFIKRSVDKCR